MALPQAGRGSALFTRAVRATESAPRILACLPWSRYTDSDPIERFWARSSAGEHYLDMVGVTGSIPVAPTIRSPRTTETERARPRPFEKPSRSAKLCLSRRDRADILSFPQWTGILQYFGASSDAARVIDPA